LVDRLEIEQAGVFPHLGIPGLPAEFGLNLNKNPAVNPVFHVVPDQLETADFLKAGIVAPAEFLPQAVAILQAVLPGKVMKPEQQIFGTGIRVVELRTQGLPVLRNGIAEFEQKGYCTIKLEGMDLRIEVGDVEILSEDIPGWLVANEGRFTVALDVKITEELRREGLARELVNRVQNLRKTQNFEITDRIHILIEKNPAFAGTLEDWGEYISTQTLALSLQQVDVLDGGTILDMDDISLNIKILKA
jgi:hypothetical protein